MKHTTLALCITLILGSQAVSANPTGAQVVHGSASFSSPNANVLNVTNSHNAIIQWQNFNIGRGQTTNFIQPSAASAVLNRVISNNPSHILGNLNSNGKVFLINQHGLLVGEGANINTSGFFGSTLNITDADFLNGKLKFSGGGLGDIHNQGYIHAGDDGHIVLIAPNIENGGVIEVDNGNIILAAGQSITITSLQNSAIEYEVSSPENSVTNLGQIIANQGAASLFAGSLRHSGSIRATGLVQDADGTIRLVATHQNEVSGQVDVSGQSGGRIEILGDVVEVKDGAVVTASGLHGGGEILIGGDQQGLNPGVQNATSTTIAAGAEVHADATDTGKGGRVIVFAENDVHVHGTVTAKGGVNGGDGGFIETSGLKVLDITAVPDASSPQGNAGDWLIDPNDIIIQAAGIDTFIDTVVGAGTTFTSNTDAAILTTATIVTALANNNVIISTGAGGAQQGNITVNDPISAAPAVSLLSLTLNAHNDININSDITSTGFSYDLILNPDSDTSGAGQINFTDTILSTGGSINLNGPAFINGVVDFGSGTVNLGGVMTINPGGQLLKGFGQIGGSGSITNDGTSIFSGGCGDGCTPVDIDVPFTNNSILRLDQVFFNVNNTMTNNGLIDLVNNPFLDGSGMKIGDGLLAGNLILNPGTSITSGLGTDITIGPLGSMDVLTPTVMDPSINLTLANGTINNTQNLTIPDSFSIFGGTLNGPGVLVIDLLREPEIFINGFNGPLTINNLVLQLGGADVFWSAFNANDDIILNNSRLIIEDQFEITNTDPGAAITGTGSDIVLGADSFLTQFSSVNTNINVPISSARGYIQLFGLGGGLTVPGDLTIQDGGHLGGVGTLNLGAGTGTLILASGGGVEPGLDFGIGTGTLFVNGNVRFEANSRGVFELNNAATDGWDQLSVSGAVTIDPGSNLYMLWDDFATQTIQTGTPLDLIFTQAGLSGSFTNIVNPVSVAGSSIGTTANSLNYQVNTFAAGPVFFWDGVIDGDGDGINWSDPLNWNLDTVPGTNALVIIESGSLASPILLTTLQPAGGGLGATQIDGALEIGAGGNLNIGGNLVTRADMTLLDGATISGSGTWHNLGFSDLAGVNTTLTVANIENHAALVWAQLGATNSILNVTGNITNYGSHLMFSPQTNSSTLNYTAPAGLVNHGFFAIDSGPDLLLNGTFSNVASAEFFMRGANVLVGGDTSMDGQLSVSPGSQLVFQGGSHSFAGTLAQAGQMVFNGGTFTGQFNQPVTGLLDITAGTGNVTFDAFTLNSLGRVRFSSAANDLVFTNASAWTNSGILDIQNTSASADFSGVGLLTNNGGTINMLSASDFNLAIDLDSDSVINITSGNFIVEGNTAFLAGNLNINNGASFTVGTGGLVSLDAQFGGVTGNGSLAVLSGGQFDFNLDPTTNKNLSSLQSLNINGGALLNSQGVILPAILNMSSGGSIQGVGDLNIPAGTAVNWNGGSFDGLGANLLNINNLGSINVLAAQALNLNSADLITSATGTLTGPGRVVVPANSRLTASVAVDVAQISLAGGDLLANGMTYSGNLDWQSGTVSGTGLTTSGVVNLQSGSLDTDWTITPTGFVQVQGPMDLLFGLITVNAGAGFTVNSGGQMIVNSASSGFSGAGLLTIDTGGLLDLNSNPFNLAGLQNFNVNGGTVENIQGLSMPVITNVSGASLLRGNGTLVIPATSSINWNGGSLSGVDTINRLLVNNQGSIDVLAGQVLSLNFTDLSIFATANLTGAGDIVLLTDNQLTASAAVDIARIVLSGGTLVANGMSYSGNLNWLSGTVTGTGLTTTGPVNLTAGILEADWTISPTGSVFWNSSSTDALVINNATITNQGSFTITSFVDLALPRPVSDNQAGKDFSASTGAGFINQGLLIIDSDPGVAGGADTVVFDLNFINDNGTIGIASGSFSLGGQDLVLDQTNDSLQGFGTFVGNVINNAGLVSPGRNDPASNVFQTGDLTILGDFTQTLNGTLGIDLDSTASGLLHDTLNVTGQLNAGGDIIFNIINNRTVLEIALLLDQSFRPLNFTTFAGRFDSVSVPAGLNFELSDNGLITITSNNTDLIQISNQLEVLFDNDDLSYSDMVQAMRFVDKRVNLALNGDEEDDEERKRAPRLVCK